MGLKSGIAAHPFRVLAAVVGLFLLLAAGLWAFDRSRADQIAPGVAIGGVDVGGLSEAQARDKLERDLLPKLQAPLVVDHGTNRWTLGAREARVTANIPASVDEAIARSRQGSLLSRGYREVTGKGLDVNLTPEVTYSDAAIVRLIDRVRSTVDRDAIDAKVEMGLNGPRLEEGRPGLKVDASQLHDRMRAAIVSATASRRLSAATEKANPKVTSAQVKANYKTAMVVNRKAFRLTLFKNFKKVKTYEIAVGAVGLETPAGVYNIQNKAVNPAWTKPHSSWVPEDERGEVVPGGTAENPLKSRWMGIFDGAGIHGIAPSEYGSIGHAASHGCVRMRIPDVEDLYDRVDVGTPIYIG